MSDSPPPPLVSITPTFDAGGIVGLLVVVALLGLLVGVVARRLGRRGSPVAAGILGVASMPAGPVALGAATVLVGAFVLGNLAIGGRLWPEAA